MIRALSLAVLALAALACETGGADATRDPHDAAVHDTAGGPQDAAADFADGAGSADLPSSAYECAKDADCSGGVCFRNQCYTTCASPEDCAPDEYCIRKARSDGTSVDVCITA